LIDHASGPSAVAKQQPTEEPSPRTHLEPMQLLKLPPGPYWEKKGGRNVLNKRGVRGGGSKAPLLVKNDIEFLRHRSLKTRDMVQREGGGGGGIRWSLIG